jgi:hypothetical protein
MITMEHAPTNSQANSDEMIMTVNATDKGIQHCLTLASGGSNGTRGFTSRLRII